MGGTTFDVSVIAGGRPPVRDGVVVEQHDLFLRMVDVESVGAGGGSLAWIDPQSGALRVGPQSAGADPGPVCYGRGGTVPTVTDADLVLRPAEPRQLPRRPDAARRRGGARGDRARSGERLGLGVHGVRGRHRSRSPTTSWRTRSAAMTIARGTRPARLRPVRVRRRRRGARRPLLARSRHPPDRRPRRRSRVGLVGLRRSGWRATAARYESPVYLRAPLDAARRRLPASTTLEQRRAERRRALGHRRGTTLATAPHRRA